VAGMDPIPLDSDMTLSENSRTARAGGGGAHIGAELDVEEDEASDMEEVDANESNDEGGATGADGGEVVDRELSTGDTGAMKRARRDEEEEEANEDVDEDVDEDVEKEEEEEEQGSPSGSSGEGRHARTNRCHMMTRSRGKAQQGVVNHKVMINRGGTARIHFNVRVANEGDRRER